MSAVDFTDPTRLRYKLEMTGSIIRVFRTAEEWQNDALHDPH